MTGQVLPPLPPVSPSPLPPMLTLWPHPEVLKHYNWLGGVTGRGRQGIVLQSTSLYRPQKQRQWQDHPLQTLSPPTLIFKEGWRTLKLEDVRAHICQPAFHREIKRLAPHHPALEWLVSLSLRVTPRSSGLFLFMVHSSITLTLFLNFFQRKTLIYIRKSSSRLGEGGSTQLSIPLPPSQANLMTCF